MKKNYLKAIAVSLAMICASPSFAGTATSTVNSQLTLTGTCSFNASSYPVSISGVSGTKLAGSAVVQIMCSPGVTASLTANAATVTDGTGGTIQGIPYMDVSHTQPMQGNPQIVTADGGYHPYTVYLEFTDASNNGVLNKIGTYVLSLPTQVAY